MGRSSFFRGGSQGGLEIAPDFGMAAGEKRPEKKGIRRRGEVFAGPKGGVHSAVRCTAQCRSTTRGKGKPFR